MARRAGTLAIAALFPWLAACSPFPDGQRRMESMVELNAKQNADFAASPDVQLPELRKRLHALGVSDASIRQTTEENGVPILMLSLDRAKYVKLDKVALAKLELDSRYRFRLTDPSQVRNFAGYSVAENWSLDRAIALKELADKGEMDRFPRYVRGRSMTIYARQLEAYCGYGPGQALRVIDRKWLEYNYQMTSDAAAATAEGQSYASFACIRRIVYATNLGPHFIGNRGRQGANDS
jgi:hypothetical protein